MSTPLRLGCSRVGRDYAEKDTTGTRHFFDSDYTRACAVSRLEICIGQIRFSNLRLGRQAGDYPPPHWGAPFIRASALEAVLA